LLLVKYPKTVLLFISHISILISLNCSRDRGISTLKEVGTDALFYSKLFHALSLHDYLHVMQAHHHADSSPRRLIITPEHHHAEAHHNEARHTEARQLKPAG